MPLALSGGMVEPHESSSGGKGSSTHEADVADAGGKCRGGGGGGEAMASQNVTPQLRFEADGVDATPRRPQARGKNGT